MAKPNTKQQVITTHDFVLHVMLSTVVCFTDENTPRVDKKTDQLKRKQDNEIINYIKEVRVSTVSNHCVYYLYF